MARGARDTAVLAKPETMLVRELSVSACLACNELCRDGT